MEDEPAGNDYAYPDLPPGAMYNAEHQCRLQFGVREASVCSPLQEVNKVFSIINCRSEFNRPDINNHDLKIYDCL